MGNTQGAYARDGKEPDTVSIASQSHFTVEQVYALLDAWRMFEHKKNEVTKAKFRKIMNSVNTKFEHPGLKEPGFVDSLFDLFDTDKSGKIEFDELVAGLSVLAAGDFEEKCVLAFTSFDTDCDGYLTAAELRAAVKRSVKNGRRLIQAQVKRIGEEEGLPAPASRVMSSVWARAYTGPAKDKRNVDELVTLLLGADTDKDKRISLDEWIEFAKKNEDMQHLLSVTCGDAVKSFYTAEDLDVEAMSTQLAIKPAANATASVPTKLAAEDAKSTASTKSFAESVLPNSNKGPGVDAQDKDKAPAEPSSSGKEQAKEGAAKK